MKKRSSSSSVCVAINGFGRIGRSLLRVLLHRRDIHICHINDPMPAEQAAYLLKYDTVMGRLDRPITVENGKLNLGSSTIALTHSRQGADIDWQPTGAVYVVNSSGVNLAREELEPYLHNGVRRLFISGPALGIADRHVFVGVNDRDLTPKDRIVSAGSCTAHCFASILTLLHKRFGIRRGFLQTVHSYTSAQNLIDGHHAKDPRRGRAAAQNIVPTTTEAIKAYEAACPEMAGVLKGMAMRVPVITGSNVDLVLELRTRTSRQAVNALLERAARSSHRGIVEFSRDPLVSSDIIGNPHSCVVDSLLTECHGPLLRLFLWYDNEWGYANRLAELIALAARQDAAQQTTRTRKR